MDPAILALVGTWNSDPSDPSAIREYGVVTLKFLEDGTLLYVIHEGNVDQVIRMTYRLEPGVIVTDQPSQSRVQKTTYEVTPHGELILTMGGTTSRYLKGQ